MTAVLLDTHAWTWSLSSDGRLSPAAMAEIAGAELVLVSPISFFEISQKVRLGKMARDGSLCQAPGCASPVAG